MTQSEPTIVRASADDDTINDILVKAGVATLYEEGGLVNWSYNGKTVPRPDVSRWAEKLLEHFNIKVVYQDTTN